MNIKNLMNYLFKLVKLLQVLSLIFFGLLVMSSSIDRNSNYESQKDIINLQLWNIEEQGPIDQLNLIVLGILIFAGLYHLYLWTRKKKDRVNLFFTVFCFFIAIFFITSKHMIIDFFHIKNSNFYYFVTRMNYCTIFLNCIVILLLFKTLFPNESWQKILWGFHGKTTILILFTLFTNTTILSNFISYIMIYLLFLCSLIVYFLLKAILSKKKYAIPCLANFSIFILAITSKMINIGIIIPIGMAIFIIIQSIILSDRYIQTYNRSEFTNKNQHVKIKQHRFKLQNKASWQYKQFSILFVVEDKKIRDLVFHGLKTNYKFFIADNWQTVYNLLYTIPIPIPDVILSDINIPEIAGCTFLKNIQKNKTYLDIPVIFLSAFEEIYDKLEEFSFGDVDYISKPFSIIELDYKIKSILENSHLRKALFENDKYATIGMLFGGIAHEIFNPIGNILAPLRNLEFFLNNQNIKEKKRITGYITRIQKNLDRIIKLIKSFRILFYKNELTSTNIDLQEIIQSIQDMFIEKMTNNIIFSYQIESSFKLKANHDALTHILINLVSNAICAVKQDGKICIEAYMQNEVPIIKVKDTGIGIKQEYLNKIFNPFFTIKEVGNGTGLGLFFVKKIVIKAGWNIFVSSVEKAGSEFIIECYQ